MSHLPLPSCTHTTHDSSADILLRALTIMASEYYTFPPAGRWWLDEACRSDLLTMSVPRHVTHVRMSKSLKFVPERLFYSHQNIEEVECHYGVTKIFRLAFGWCPSLRRVIIPGVRVIKDIAFCYCEAMTYVECGKLEIIGGEAFRKCRSLSGIDLPSIKIVEGDAFNGCRNLTYVKFGKDLESIGERAFLFCRSLQRIAIPLKDGIITNDSVFTACKNLERVDLVGGVHETVAALLLEEWRNDMNEEIYAINQILPNTPAGGWDWINDELDPGKKAQAIRTWLRKVLHKYIYYKAEHRRYVNEAAATLLRQDLPRDVVLKNILPFLTRMLDPYDM